MRKLRKRYDWLIRLVQQRKFLIGVEVGVDAGETTYRLLKNCPNLRMYTVDNWGVINDPDQGVVMDWGSHEKVFHTNTAPYKDQLVVLKGLSWEQANKVPDSSVDFVFIDADHRYLGVSNDILAWARKIKSEGMLCGHDINIEGVRKAVGKYLPDWKDSGVSQIWYCWRKKIMRRLLLVQSEERFWEFIRILRNDKRVQEGFIKQVQITPKQQQQYMSQYNDHYWICLDGNLSPVGYIGEIEGDIRVAVIPEAQHKGIGKFMVGEFMLTHLNSTAKVKLNNVVSCKLFESCEFDNVGKDEEFIYFKRNVLQS